MQIVIKIPKRVYNYIRKYEHIANSDVLDIKDAILNGTPLPKGHGRLIDADKLHHCECKGNFSECDTCLDDDLCNLVNEAPTIIEGE